MCDDSDLWEEYERKSDVDLLVVLMSDAYRDEVRGLARRVLAARLGVPVADAALVITTAVTALAARAAGCHLCVAATDVAQRHEFLVCRAREAARSLTETALSIVGVVLIGVPFPKGDTRYEVVSLTLNLCAACAGARQGTITKDLCLEHPLVEMLYRGWGFTEIRWPAELRADQRADAEPPLVRAGARVLTSAGFGTIRRVTLAGKAVIDLDAGGSVALDPGQILAVSDGGTGDG